MALRNGIPEAQDEEGPSLEHDVTAPVSRIPEFAAATGRALQEALPGIRTATDGHVGVIAG